MGGEKELRRFVIRKFITTLVWVGVVEYILLAFINNLMLPVVIDNFVPQIRGFKILTMGTVILVLILLLVYLLIMLLTKLLPVGLGFFAELITAALSNLGIGDANGVLAGIAPSRLVAFALTLLVIMIIVILPLAAGSVIFARQITAKIKLLEEEHDMERRENERRRYLMISDIAHDLKTPMTTVSGYAKALSDGIVKDDKKQEYLNAITDKTARMNDIVQMLFDYVRLDSEGFELVQKDVDVCELLRECVATLYQDIEDKGDDIDVDIPDERIIIKADKMQFGRVVSNLISNAVRHNDGGTSIGVKLVRDTDEIRIFIADNGKEISEELCEHLFEPFVMGDKSRASSGGSGLGLSIAKKITDLHGFRLKLVQRPEIARYRLDDKYGKVFVIIIRQ
ncbi:Signal transduction histidine kinase [Ruminococcaceae bacterium YRB3002]|nr:Signal transduction histidine kinase [Ruminococcaceae bacterium YRB3002]